MAGDSAAFLETVRHLLSGNNELRKPAEKRYEDAKRNQPTATFAALFQIVQEPRVELPVREQSAVLLRQCLNRAGEPGSLWHGLGEAAQADARIRLLQLLEAEPLRPLRRKIADAVQSLGNSIINIDSDARPNNAQEWPELMPTLLRVVADGSRDSGIRADCLWAVKEMAISVWQVLLTNTEQTQQLLLTCLSDPADQVKADAVSLLCSFADSIESREDRKPFEPLIPQVFTVLSHLAAAPDPTQINEVLQAMQVTTEVADYFKGHISSHVLPLMSKITMSHSDSAARKYALEVLLSFLQSKPKLLMKSPEFVQRSLEVCVHLLVQLPDDLADWLEDDPEDGGEAEERDEEVFFACGKAAIDRISCCAQRVDSFSTVLEVLKPVIARFIQSANWKEVVAAITTLRQIAEYVDDEALVTQMMQAVKVHLQASHPRVRHAAWCTVAQFSVDHSDVISTDTWVAELMPLFVAGLDDGCLRVCVRSMEAFQHYGEDVERDDMESFLPALMERLGAKLQGGSMLQRKAITYISVIARQSEEAFAPYCAPLMPVLKGTIQATLHKVEERTLLGRCFECISLLAKAMGREAFKADAELIMQAMVQATQIPDLPKDDPVKEYMMSACERICGALKEDFAPFVPHVLPGVLEKLRIAAPQEVGAEGSADDDDEELEEGTELTVVREGGKFKVMTMHSSDMQDLKGALECVLEFSGQMGKSYAQYVSQTAQAILPIFDFSMAEEIRNLAFETWGQLCRCAKDGGHPQVVSELLMEFLKRILPKLEDGGKSVAGVDVLALKTRTDGTTTCLRHAGPGILSAEQVRHLCNVAMSLTSDSLKRREESAEAANADKRKDKGDDEGGGIFVITGEMEEDEEEEQALRTSLMEIAGAVMQHHPDAFVVEAFPSYLALVQRLAVMRGADAASCTEDRQLALFIACDFLEHLGARVTAQWPQFLPLLMEDVMHTDAQVRTAACFGLSLAAKEAAFASLATTAAAKLAELVVQSRQREKRKAERTAQAAADNALSALAEILLNHVAALGAGSKPTEQELWAIWTAGLPCQEDEAEGVRNHATLLSLLQQEKPEVVGEGGANVARLLGILVDNYQTDMVNEETSKGIGQLLLRLGNARLETYAAQYTAKQRKRLQRIVEEAQRETKA